MTLLAATHIVVQMFLVSDPGKLPSLSGHDLLTIRHTHAVWMCVSVKILLLLEITTETLALGYRTIFVL